ncbi:SDR family oxidoreductase [Actinomadura sp. SCN-SB]|uniref:SDR family oxidoreductase n=1 Tax=Actinomadura sp. SCN-SB TaxID=3373092 RepID=UPI003752A254
MPYFTDKVVVVTGAASGFGEATAHAFASAGGRVVVADIDAGGARRVAEQLDGAVAVRTDVSDAGSVRTMVAAAADAFGGIDVLVNNAGVPHRSMPMLDLPVEEADRMWAVNVRSVFLCCKYAVPMMRGRQGASVVNVASIGAVRPRPGMTVYNASKGAVLTLTRGLAAELAPEVRVNAMNPVVAETGFVRGAQGVDRLPEEMRAAMVAGIPMGRLAEPRDVADTICFLASPEARFLTGVCLDVDGGRSIQ